MTTTKPRKVLAALREVACEDILSMSDQDVLKEARGNGMDTTAITERVKSGMLEVLSATRRDRLALARRKIDQAVEFKQKKINHPPIPIIRSILQGLSNTNSRVQLAFREGKTLTDCDATSLYDDLVQLGVIRDENSKY